jgi:hypothetical protein
MMPCFSSRRRIRDVSVEAWEVRRLSREERVWRRVRERVVCRVVCGVMRVVRM